MVIGHEAIRPYVEALWGWDAREQEERFRAQFEPSQIEVIQVDGRDVGYFRLEDFEDCVFLSGIYIGKGNRRKGIGSNVLAELMNRANKISKPLRLRVLLPNPAQRLYLKLGFRITDTTDSHIHMEFKSSASATVRGNP